MSFGQTSFMPHGMCYSWQPDVLTLHVVSDAVIALAYFAIPATLAWFVRKRRDIPFKGIFLMFSLFIVSCGLTHVLSIWVIWHPDYWIEGFVKGVTAMASIATAILLAPLMPRALALRSPRELERLNAELAQTLDELHSIVRRYEHEKYIAESFQSASLSDIPPQIADIAVSAMYRPGSGDLEIGGDWYDAFGLLDGRIVVSIGDVTGTGLAASIIMSKIRQAIRVAAQIQVDPARILDAASRSLEIEFPDVIVTAFVGIIDEVEGVLQYANAGHPRPLVRLPNGTLEELSHSGLPLGLRRRGDEQCALWELQPGSLAVLYTDGLTESTRDYSIGEQRLRRALGRKAIVESDDPARAIFDAILFDGIRDDVAILTLRLGFPKPIKPDEHWRFQSADHGRAGEVRHIIANKLVARGATKDHVFDADMVFAELLGNVCRHAPGMVGVQVDWRGDTMVLHVFDDGSGFEFLPELPDDLMSERGRGLFIVNALVEDFHIKPHPRGGSHARAVLRAPRRDGGDGRALALAGR
jgi:serine phosphatase RsbU (regulator of sigma subunit)/anti-sigma regulatory factor (Ser/Thr protein kinase)